MREVLSVLFAFVAFLFWPGIFGVLVGFGFSSILLGVAAFLFVLWLIQLHQNVSDIHRWTKRINGTVRTDKIEERHDKEIIRFGKFHLYKNS